MYVRVGISLPLSIPVYPADGVGLFRGRFLRFLHDRFWVREWGYIRDYYHFATAEGYAAAAAAQSANCPDQFITVLLELVGLS